MNFKNFLILTGLWVGFFSSCKNDDPSIGNNIKPEGDSIIALRDTFILPSKTFFADSIFLKNDTLLLGELYDKTFGTTKAELLFQVTPPVGYIFPTQNTDEIRDAAPDSLVLFIYYNTWFGAGLSPMEFSLYEADKKTLNYSDSYFSNIDIKKYASISPETLIGTKVLIPQEHASTTSALTDTIKNPFSIRYKLRDEYAKKFFSLPKEAYESEEKFHEAFKGFLLTTRYGSSAILHLKQIELRLYYHYSRLYSIENQEFKDTISTWVNYSLNREARHANAISHTDRAEIRAKIESQDSAIFLKSPAGMYAEISLPIGKIAQTLRQNVGAKRLAINKAAISFEETGENNLPKPNYLLLIKKENLETYFQQNLVPELHDTISVIGSYNLQNQKYQFNFSYFVDEFLKNEEILADKTIEMVAVPIEVGAQTFGDQTFFSSVSPLFKLSGATIKSGKNKVSPLSMEIFYSGF